MKFTNKQYTTINQSTAGRFDPRVFVNCLQVTCKQLTISEFHYQDDIMHLATYYCSHIALNLMLETRVTLIIVIHTYVQMHCKIDFVLTRIHLRTVPCKHTTSIGFRFTITSHQFIPLYITFSEKNTS